VLADPQLLRSVLCDAGFSRVELHSLDGDVCVGTADVNPSFMIFDGTAGSAPDPFEIGGTLCAAPESEFTHGSIYITGSATVEIGVRLDIGDEGLGNLTVDNGSIVNIPNSSNSDPSFIGAFTGATGLAVVKNGSQLNNNGRLTIGDGGFCDSSAPTSPPDCGFGFDFGVEGRTARGVLIVESGGSVTTVYGHEDRGSPDDVNGDKPTVLNLTNHSYFNLGGQDMPDVLGHILTIHADRHLHAGQFESVEGTPLDFRAAMAIGDRIDQVEGGYDLAYDLGNTDGTFILAARAVEPISGRVMEIHTTEPSLVLYTANFLDGSAAGKGGRPLTKQRGVCFEAEHFPDSPNHPEWPSVVLNPGEVYTQTTAYRFSTE